MTSFRMHGIADGLCRAASPTFALMALLTALSPSSEMLCMPVQDGLPIGGMVPMYLLMSAFHAGPWLRLIAPRPARPELLPRTANVAGVKDRSAEQRR